MLIGDRFAAALAQAKRHQGHLCILLIDLLQFDGYFTRFGHDIADAMLKVLVMRMNECVRETDTLARVGPTRFVVLAPQLVNRDTLEAVAKRMSAALARPCRVGADWVDVATRTGVVMYPNVGDDMALLIASAEVVRPG